MENIKIYNFIFLIISIFLLVSLILYWPDNKLHYVQCDVGQGDGALISRGFKQILIDTGRDRMILDCLGGHMPFWDKNIDMLILSHQDSDHSGGLDEVVSSYKIKQFYYNGKDDQSETWQKILDDLKNKQTQINIVNGQTYQLNQMQIKFLSPNKNTIIFKDDNQGSVVNTITYGDYSVIFTGDIDESVENELIRDHLSLANTVLKVSHHGSKYSSSSDFLTKVNPKLAVIGVGKNSYGHPDMETLQRLADLKIKILRTDQQGDIEIISDGKSWWLKK